MRKTTLLGLIGLFLTTQFSLGQQTILTFEDLTGDTNPYLADGFQLETDPGSLRPTTSLNGAPSSNTSLFPSFGFDDHAIEITRTDGGTFSFIGFDLLEPFSLNTFPGPAEFSVSGTRADGSIISTVVEIDGNQGSQSFGFNDFHDLISLSVRSADDFENIAIDNLILSNSLLIYPQLALGGGYEVVLIATNQSGINWKGEARLNGGNWMDQWSLNGSDQSGASIFELNLGPNETRKYTLQRKGNLMVGMLEIEPAPKSSNIDLSTSYFFNYVSKGKLEDSTGVAPIRLTKAVRFPVEFSSEVNTGFAVKNSLEPVRFTLYDESGSMLQQVTAPFNDAKFLNEIFFSITSDLIGSVEVYAPSGLSIVVIRLESIQGGGFQLTSIPALNIEP